MEVNSVIDVLTVLFRANEFNNSDRLTLITLELLQKLAAEYEGFDRLRMMIELYFPADPFARLLTTGRPSVPLPPMDDVVRGFVARVLGTGGYRISHLDGIVNLHPGDFHLVMAGHPFPVSIAFQEMELLAAVLRAQPTDRPVRVLEIGTGFGISATFLAAVAATLPQGYEVVTVDPFVEDQHTDRASVHDAGYDPTAVDYTQNLSYQSFQALGREFAELTVQQVLDYSPQCFAHPAIAGKMFDVVFIDGNHFGEQPTIDFEGALAVTHPETLFLFHDGHAPGVVPLLEKLRAESWAVTNHATSCNLTSARRPAPA